MRICPLLSDHSFGFLLFNLAVNCLLNGIVICDRYSLWVHFSFHGAKKV